MNQAKSRRAFFGSCGIGFGGIALASLLHDESPGALRRPHFMPRAKHVIYLHMIGAPSQLDLYDEKPELVKLHNQPCPPEVTKGRDFAAWLGLVPQQRSTGDRTILGRISKRGDGYLRSLQTQGARSFLIHAHQYKGDRLAEWALRLSQGRHHNKVAIAVANKLTRVVWAVWTRGEPYSKLARTAA